MDQRKVPERRVAHGKTTLLFLAMALELSPAAVADAANRAPTISGIPQGGAQEGLSYAFTPAAADADGDALSFSIANRPAWATFNTATGALSGTPGIGSVGIYANIVIGVSDGAAIASLPAFSIGVQQTSFGSATVSWQAPTQRVDGSVLTDLSGYRIHFGTVPGSYPYKLWIFNPGITTYVISNLPPGTYYFAATAFDSAGRESEISNVVSKTIGS